MAAAVARPTSRRKMSALKEFSSRQARQHQERWWRAIERALRLPEEELPSVRAPLGPQALPQPRSWQRHHAEAATALEAVRAAVRERAAAIRVPQELLLAPECQRRLAWSLGLEGRQAPAGPSALSIGQHLEAMGARPWQVEQVAGPIAERLG